jgi:ubiquinone/menaquinone biosynthesis C-methylase UbiE
MKKFCSDKNFYDHYFSGDDYERVCFLYDVGSSSTREAIRKMITKSSGYLLEIGLGLGFFLSEVPYFKRVGVDLSFETLKKAERSIPRDVFLVNCNAENLPFQNRTMDIVTSTHTFEHIPDIQKAIKEIYRVMKPDGELVVFVPASLTGKVSKKEQELMGHLRTFSRSEFEKQFRGLFKIEKIYYAHFLHNLVWLRIKVFLLCVNFLVKRLRKDRKSFYERKIYQKRIMPFLMKWLNFFDYKIGRTENNFWVSLLRFFEKRRCICLRAVKV